MTPHIAGAAADVGNGIQNEAPFLGQQVQPKLCPVAWIDSDDELEFAHLGVGNHPVELHPLFRAGPCDALIRINPVQLPVRLTVDVLPEIPLLGLEGVGLILLVRGHPAVTCD